MLVTLFGIVILSSDEQASNTKGSMRSILARIVMLFSAPQCIKAPTPMLVTLSGIVTFSRDEQDINAVFPILVTDLPLYVLLITTFESVQEPIPLTS